MGPSRLTPSQLVLLQWLASTVPAVVHGQIAPAAGPLPTTANNPCDQWAQILNHNAVNSKVDATCTAATGAPAPSDKPPCHAGNPTNKGYYLLGHSDDFASCMLLAEEMLPADIVATGDAVAAGRICKVVTWHNPQIPPPYTKTCYCGVALEYIGPNTPQANIDSAACTHYGSAWGATFLLALFVCTTLYLSAGVAHSVKIKGQQLGPRSLPHREYWLQLAGLVRDGAVWSIAQAIRQGGMPVGKEQPETIDPAGLLGADRESVATAENVASPASTADANDESNVAEANDSVDSDSDELVE